MRPFFSTTMVIVIATTIPPDASQGEPWQQSAERLVREAVAGSGVTNARVLDAVRHTPRHEFVPRSRRRLAYFDMALPIGDGQTISPPFIVAYMTEQLDPQPDDWVLEIGTGSGYQAAVLSPLVAEVYTIEIVPTLGRRAAAALQRLGYTNVHTKIGDGFQGWAEHAPYDKIIVTCSPEAIPQPLVDELKEGGRMVIPVGERYQQTLYLMTKRDGKLVEEALRPTLFVPMTGAAEASRQKKPDPRHPRIVNGGFERLAGQSPTPTGWHYQRQMSVISGNAAPEGQRFVRFQNSESGRWSQALQGLAIDGKTIAALDVWLSVKAANVARGSRDSSARLMITFYDQRRAAVGRGWLGPWHGTFAWKHLRQRIRVPKTAREAILAVGLLGTTGTLDVDDLRVEPVARADGKPATGTTNPSALPSRHP